MSYTDWIPSFVEMTTGLKNLTVLEFGLGKGTTYFVDTFKHVHTVEINDCKDWFNIVESSLGDRTNWSRYYYDVETYKFKRVEMSNNNILGSLFEDVKKAIDFSTIDVVFVDPAIRQRWEIAQYFLDNKFKRVVVHDWLDQFSYGYQFIKSNNNYEITDYNVGCFTRHFALKNKSATELLEKTVDKTEKKTEEKKVEKKALKKMGKRKN